MTTSVATTAYSVLMSIYKKENPTFLRQALDSMLVQTVPPAEIVMVKDGPLTAELESVLSEYNSQWPDLFKFVSYSENHGLGYALHKGVLSCSNEIVARMDTDDVARPDRMEKQLAAIESGLDMVGSDVVEFIDSPETPIASTNLPKGLDNILACSKRRNPFRHPPMTFKKTKVLEAGNYSSEYLYFEDWDLFNRMLASGCRADNLPEPLVAMRVAPIFMLAEAALRIYRISGNSRLLNCVLAGLALLILLPHLFHMLLFVSCLTDYVRLFIRNYSESRFVHVSKSRSYNTP